MVERFWPPGLGGEVAPQSAGYLFNFVENVAARGTEGNDPVAVAAFGLGNHLVGDVPPDCFSEYFGDGVPLGKTDHGGIEVIPCIAVVGHFAQEQVMIPIDPFAHAGSAAVVAVGTREEGDAEIQRLVGHLDGFCLGAAVKAADGQGNVRTVKVEIPLDELVVKGRPFLFRQRGQCGLDGLDVRSFGDYDVV